MKLGICKLGIFMTSRLIKLLTFVILVSLTGCAYLATGVDAVKTANDTIAQGLIAGMCGISVGAYYRLQSPLHKDGIKKLCGGSNAIELGE